MKKEQIPSRGGAGQGGYAWHFSMATWRVDYEVVCRGGCRRDDVWWNVSYDERMDAGVAHDETNGLGDGGSRPRLLPTKV